jgi:hypothetical protein
VARLLIVGEGSRARRLAAELVRERHAVRVVASTEAGRRGIESVGAECWIGTPDRLATLRGALDGVTIACWLLAAAQDGEEEVLALHDARLRSFLAHAVDTTMRGFVYEAPAAGVRGETAGASKGDGRTSGGGNGRASGGGDGKTSGGGVGRASGGGDGRTSGGDRADRGEADAGEADGRAITAGGERIVRALASRNAIPVAFVRADPGDLDAWLEDARGVVAALLGVRS